MGKDLKSITSDEKRRVDDLLSLLDHTKLSDIVMVEVGCFAGLSTSLFCAHDKVSFLNAVDRWEGKYRGRDMTVVEKQFDDRMEQFHNFKKMKMRSTQAAILFADRSLDLVYLDGLHTYRGVKADILAWKPKIKIGGYIAGHDYRENANLGVKAAVNHHLGTPEAVFCDSSWIFEVKD